MRQGSGGCTVNPAIQVALGRPECRKTKGPPNGGPLHVGREGIVDPAPGGADYSSPTFFTAPTDTSPMTALPFTTGASFMQLFMQRAFFTSGRLSV